ncbi:MAG: hypothetical protein NXI17_05850 [Alphaproteobacteria bacterium]|nr:hypothetical protein [Alphaproteobacteria bacterium]
MSTSKIKLSLVVKARMLARQEVLRDKALDTNIFDNSLILGLIEQNGKLRHQMYSMTRNAVFLLFLAFVALSGGDITIPGTGSKIGDIPAFFEISLVLCAIQLSFIPVQFLSTQLYAGVISVFIEARSADGSVDHDLVNASKEPVWLFVKYATSPITVRRPDAYEISEVGRIFYALMVASFSILILSAYLMINVSMLYLAHFGLSDSFVQWCIYIFCWFCFAVVVFGAIGNGIAFTHTTREELILEDPMYSMNGEEAVEKDD